LEPTNQAALLILFMLVLIPIILTLVPSQGAQAQSGGPVFLAAPVIDAFEVRVSSPRDWRRVRALASDLDEHGPRDGWVRALGDDSEQARLRAAGLGVRVLQEDLTSFYADRAAAAAPGSMGLVSGSMGGFRTLAEIDYHLAQLATLFPQLASPVLPLGVSHEGRSVNAIRISTSPASADPQRPTVMYDALHHGREPMSGEALMRFIDYLLFNYGNDPEVTYLLERREFLIVPCVNPDGYEYNHLLAPMGGGLWRKNKSVNSDGTWGVDLNRNYGWEWGPAWPGSSSNPGQADYHGPAAFSEPETRAMRDLMAAQPPAVAVSVHAAGNLWIFPWGYDAIMSPHDGVFRSLAGRAAGPVGWSYGTIWELLSTANGSSLDWMYGQHGCLALAVEIGTPSDGFWPAPTRFDALFEEVLVGFIEAARVAGPWADLGPVAWVQQEGDGDLEREPGESWNVFVGVKNRGREAASGNVILESSSDAFVLMHGSTDFQLAPHSGQQMGPLGVKFRSDATVGTPLVLDIVLTTEGRSERKSVPVVLGEPQVLVFDDMQTADFGWTVGDDEPWSFERRQPVRTLIQPGTDHSGLSGGKAWVTGFKGGGPDANDVDGITRLTSPRVRAGHLDHLELSYARWFSTSNGPGDRFLAEVSADDGATWVELESLERTADWSQPRFFLEQYSPLSDNMRLRFSVIDTGADDTVEGLLDDFQLQSRTDLPSLGLWGQTSLGQPLGLILHHPPAPGASFTLLWSLSAGPGQTNVGVLGELYLLGTVRILLAGSSDGFGHADIPTRIPSLSALKNLTVHMQVLLDPGTGPKAYSNLVSFTVE
jgi:hypothetical protein